MSALQYSREPRRSGAVRSSDQLPRLPTNVRRAHSRRSGSTRSRRQRPAPAGSCCCRRDGTNGRSPADSGHDCERTTRDIAGRCGMATSTNGDSRCGFHRGTARCGSCRRRDRRDGCPCCDRPRYDRSGYDRSGCRCSGPGCRGAGPSGPGSSGGTGFGW